MTRDGHVRLLPLHVANKIAAGEVVERPASVLKELLENAIDAGATRVEVSISAGGRKLISVRDNGCGMTKDDAVLSLERQATSKIRDVDDIERIDTLGFRGEAIPSIAAVSRFTLVTRTADADEGTKITVNAGTLAEISACGAPPGTRVEVRDLFCNVPARRKFLRAYTTEEAHIRNTFAVHALAHPEIAMSLSVDGREVSRFAGGATMKDRIRDLYGPDFPENLLPVSLEGQISVCGYVERPGLMGSFRREQHIFINGRPASSPVISYALKDAYPSRPGDTRPTAILFIGLPPDLVDVNVHPAKREVRFRRPSDIREALSRAVTEALRPPSSAPATEQNATVQIPQPDVSSGHPEPDAAPAPVSQAQDLRFQVPIQPVLPRYETPPAENTVRQNGEAEITSEENPRMETASGPWRWFEFLAQTTNGFILLETDAGIVTIHPQAAQERIVYERLLNGSTSPSQPLLIPETVRLTPLESAKIAAFADVLAAQGFQMESFGDNVWKLDAVPQAADTAGAGDMLAAIAHDIAESGARRGGAHWREELVARSAARAVSGSATRFTPDTARKLVEQLASCKMPYVCPRGKPVMTFTSNRELSRKFNR